MHKLRVFFVLLVLVCLVAACDDTDQDQTKALEATVQALQATVAAQGGQATPISPGEQAVTGPGPAQPAPTGGAQAQPAPTATEQAEAQPTQPAEQSATAQGGHLIVFTSLRDSTPYQVNQEIYLMNPDGSQQVNLTRHWAWDDAPDWSPDGKKIAFWSDRDGNPDIYVMDADGANVQRLTGDPARDINPAWSPDGMRIAFVSERNGQTEIFLMNADGSGQAPLALTDDPKRPRLIDFPVWSPDGSRIAFLASYPGQALSGQIRLVSPDGSNEEKLSGASVFGRPAWSPDGKQISFARCNVWAGDDPTPEIYIVNLDGSESTRLAALAMDASPTWSPDGKAIVFESDRAAETDYHHDLYLVSLEGPLEQADASWVKRLTTAEGRSPAWSPAGVMVDLAALAGLPAAAPVTPSVSTVCASGCDFTSIQAAVDAAQPGQTVEVRSGQYAEAVVIDKPLTLRGVDSGNGPPTISQNWDTTVVAINAGRVILEGFTLSQTKGKISQAFPGLVVIDRSGHNAVVGNTFSYCGGFCILLKDADSNSIYQNRFGATSATGPAPAGGSPGGGGQAGGVVAAGQPAQAPGAAATVTPRAPGPAAAPATEAVFSISLDNSSYNQLAGNAGQILHISIDGSRNLAVGNTAHVNLGPYGNTVANNQGSISMLGSYLNTLGWNQISLAEVGIQSLYGELNLIAHNTVDRNYYGIYLHQSDSNLIYANQVSNSASYGIVLSGRRPAKNVEGVESDDFQRPYLNVVCRNSLTGNKADAYDSYLPGYWEAIRAGYGESYRNRWYYGGAGNYYSSYDDPAEGCQDANSDLFCDAGYAIPGGDTVDPYPLVKAPASP